MTVITTAVHQGGDDSFSLEIGVPSSNDNHVADRAGFVVDLTRRELAWLVLEGAEKLGNEILRDLAGAIFDALPEDPPNTL